MGGLTLHYSTPATAFPFLVSSKCFSKLLVVLPSVNQCLINQHFPAFRSRPHILHGYLLGTTSSDELSLTLTVVPTAHKPRFKLCGMAQSPFLWSPTSHYTSSSTPSLPHPFHFCSSCPSLLVLLHHFLIHSITSTHLLHHFHLSTPSLPHLLPDFHSSTPSPPYSTFTHLFHHFLFHSITHFNSLHSFLICSNHP